MSGSADAAHAARALERVAWLFHAMRPPPAARHAHATPAAIAAMPPTAAITVSHASAMPLPFCQQRHHRHVARRLIFQVVTCRPSRLAADSTARLPPFPFLLHFLLFMSLRLSAVCACARRAAAVRSALL